MDRAFWNNKKVLVTGHTGFKGSWLSLWLQQMGADVIGFALPPPTQPSLFEMAGVADGMTSIIGDIRDQEAVTKLFSDHQPDIVFHMAAQSLVRYSYDQPVETYATNVMGTLHILEAMRAAGSVRAAVMVTSDKCYENREWVWAYRENDPMGGHDPYSSSKGCAELLTASYRSSYFPPENYDSHRTAVGSARAGNVIGGGDWAGDRLIPDIVRAFQAGGPVRVRNPNAIRPWQHVLVPLSGYLSLAEHMVEAGVNYAEGWNFGPLDEDARPVGWIVEKMAEAWGDNASWTVDEGEHPHEANFLKLDFSKARAELSWRPEWTLQEAIARVVDWHKAEIDGADLKQKCLDQIGEYEQLLGGGE